MSARIAGLSERNVVTMPREAAPGSPKTGRISGRSRRSIRATKPNSVKSSETAPMMTHTATIYRTVLIRRSNAVFMIVLIMFAMPMRMERYAKNAIKMTGKTTVSALKVFLTVYLLSGFIEYTPLRLLYHMARRR